MRGAAATGLVLGIVAKLTTGSVPASMSESLDRLRLEGTFSRQYFGIAFLFVATVVALLPASQVGAASEEESSGRLVHILVRPTRRATWFGGRLAISALGIMASALLAGLAAWLGAWSQGVDVGLPTLVGAGLNVIPTALLVLGIGAVGLAVAPRAAAGTVYAVIVWSAVVDLLSLVMGSMRWLEKTSLFHYMALAPAQRVDPLVLAATTAIGVVLCVAATVLFDRRDVAGT